MPAIGIREILFVLLVFAFIFGAKRLPDIARGLGNGIRNFKGSLRAPRGDDSGDADDSRA
ncbi:MAG: twin-arginine translocase TatA/TatE family subunit [Gemmatimonadota bacterium]|nr:twin-arginine translocase TatA/TatE family subunit [Gemmatimonadota bacterium]